MTTTSNTAGALAAPGVARTTLALGLTLAIVAAMASASPLPQAWRNWHYSRAVQLEATYQPRLVNIVVPAEVYIRAEIRLPDLRIVDDLGREVPYVLQARQGSTRTQMRSTRVRETSFAPGQFTQVVLDLGENPSFHNAVQVITAEPDFITWVEVDVSDTARDWRIVRDRSPIFRFHKENLEGNQTLRYSDSNARYLRLRFLDGAKPFPLVTATAAYDVSESAERAPVLAPLKPDTRAKPQESRWRTEAGAALLPVAEVRFEAEQAEFRRRVRVSSSEDGEIWETRGAGEIYRFRQGDTLLERLQVDFPEAWGLRYWRVEVVNGNDPPLTGARPVLCATPRHVVFRQEPGRSYRLLYGQSEAKAPQYEMARLADPRVLDTASTGALAPEEINTAYMDPRPWTEQHPFVLWVALGVAVVILGYSALRALQSQT